MDQTGQERSGWTPGTAQTERVHHGHSDFCEKATAYETFGYVEIRRLLPMHGEPRASCRIQTITQPYLKAIEDFRLKPKECFVVGDEPWTC